MDKGMMVTLLKMVLSLAAVLAVFGGAVWCFRKFAGGSKGFLKKTGATKPLEILAFQNLGPGRSIYLLRCLDKKVLIGATNTNINHLGDIPEPDEDMEEVANAFRGTLDEKADGKPEQSLKRQMSASLREISRV